MSASLSAVGAASANHSVVLPKTTIPQCPQETVVPEEEEEAAELALLQSLPNPKWDGALKAQEELLQFQTECTDPELRELVTEMIQMKQQNQVLDEEVGLMRALITRKADVLLKSVKYELFQLIQRSPELKKRLSSYVDNYCKEDLEIDLRDVIKKLEHGIKTKPKQEMEDEWVLMNPDQSSQKSNNQVVAINETKIISLDLEALKQLKQEVALIQSILDGTKNSKEFFIEIKAIRSRGGLPKPETGWETTASSTTSYSILSSLTFAGRIAVAIAPSLKIGLMILFPTSSLTIINIMLSILSAAGSSE